MIFEDDSKTESRSDNVATAEKSQNSKSGNVFERRNDVQSSGDGANDERNETLLKQLLKKSSVSVYDLIELENEKWGTERCLKKHGVNKMHTTMFCHCLCCCF